MMMTMTRPPAIEMDNMAGLIAITVVTAAVEMMNLGIIGAAAGTGIMVTVITVIGVIGVVHHHQEGVAIALASLQEQQR